MAPIGQDRAITRPIYAIGIRWVEFEFNLHQSHLRPPENIACAANRALKEPFSF
jgi:hypothetical protein